MVEEKSVATDEVDNQADQVDTFLDALRRAIETGIVFRVIIGAPKISLTELRHQMHSGDLFMYLSLIIFQMTYRILPNISPPRLSPPPPLFFNQVS